MPIELNELETKRFGIIAARLIDTAADFSEINVAAAEQGVAMLSTRVPVDDLSRVHQLEADGYKLMDTLVYYQRKLTDLPKPPERPHEMLLRPSGPADAKAVAQLSKAAFTNYIGHYHTDPYLDNTAADAVYVQWAENSILHADLPAILLEVSGHLAGFMTLRRNNSKEAEIVLNAVHPTYASRGIYRHMLVHAMIQCQELGVSSMIVSTQINNYKVQRAWVSQGMSLSCGYYTFHKWYGAE